MKSTLIHKWNIALLIAAGIFSNSCTDNVMPSKDNNVLGEGDYPLSFTAIKDEPSSRVAGKSDWVAETDIIGVRFGEDGLIGKYKITDASAGITEALTEVKWPTASATINAWFPWTAEAMTLDISDQSMQEDQSAIDILIAKAENASYDSDITLTFKHALPQLECTFTADGDDIDLSKLTDVKFLSASSLKFENGVLSKVNESPIGVKPYNSEGRYSAMIYPENMSGKEFISVNYDGKVYKFRHTKANFESGKKYIFTIDLTRQAIQQWVVETLYYTPDVSNNGSDGVYGSGGTLCNPSVLWYNSNDKRLYFIENVNDASKSAVRAIDFTTNTFSTILTAADPIFPTFTNYNKCFFDTDNNMYVLKKHWNTNEITIAKGTPKGDGSFDWSEMPTIGKGLNTCTGISISSNDPNYMYLTGEMGKLYQINLTDNTVTLVSEYFPEPVAGGQKPNEGAWQMEYSLDFAPDGTFAYFVNEGSAYHHVIRADYDNVTHTFSNLLLISTFDRNWSVENTSETMKLKDVGFCNPRRGTFDENGNYYLCDNTGHTVRRIDRICSDDNPNSVTTFSGAGWTSGDIDGAVLDARFNEPHGISYDKENKVFYVSEPKKNRIRKISFE